MNTIIEWWPIIIATVAAIAWLIRLEAKIVMGNKILELHKQNCVERHTTERMNDVENLKKIDDSISKLFDLIRTVQSGIDEIRGWKNGIQKN